MLGLSQSELCNRLDLKTGVSVELSLSSWHLPTRIQEASLNIRSVLVHIESRMENLIFANSLVTSRGEVAECND